jgi:hypothetical protein
VQPIAAYHKARRVLGAIRERDFYCLLALLKLNCLVAPFDLNTVLLGRVDQKLLKLCTPDSDQGETKAFSHSIWRNIIIDENVLLSVQGGAVNHPIWRSAGNLFNEAGDE